ncbi:hypothetical protein KI387_015257, partial [Taxus chinensis]
LKHRGPDWSGIYQHGNCFITHQRLAIVDPASGDQPLYSEDKTIAVSLNGEIYNHEKLRGSLPSHEVQSGSDCEVISHLYEENGEDLVKQLDGGFSFVLLDSRDDSFIAARDAIGITPLYMGWGLDGSIWFASEMKGLHNDCERFESFPPGHIYSSKHGGIQRWYNPPWYSEDTPSAPYDPLELQKAFEQNSPDLMAAKEVAQCLGTIHHEFNFSVQDGIDAIEDVIYHIETFDVTTVRASTPMFLMACKIKSLRVKMVLSGEGADEIFGDYLYFHQAPNKEEFHREACHKIKALHLYDCLRANKATAAWGVEVRVSFLDEDYINVAMGIDPQWKMGFEMIVLQHILYRQKEQFSDGVGYNWIDGLKEHAATLECQYACSIKQLYNNPLDGHFCIFFDLVTDTMMKNVKFVYPDNTPLTKEAYFYRMIFERFFPQNATLLTVPGGPSVACSRAKAIE